MRQFILTTSTILLVCGSIFSQTKNFIDQPYIEVTGSADTLVTPNLIFIKIVISEKQTRDKISIEEQENKMIAAFNAMGINTQLDLTTSDMLSNYKNYLFKKNNILKTKEYSLKVTTAEATSNVFIQLEELGISSTSIDRVEHSDFENLKNACRTKAIENSHKKAVALTKPIAQTVGNAIHITDNESTSSGYQLASRSNQILMVSSFDLEKYKTPTIEFEKIKVSASVSVKYVLK